MTVCNFKSGSMRTNLRNDCHVRSKRAQGDMPQILPVNFYAARGGIEISAGFLVSQQTIHTATDGFQKQL